MKSIEIMAELKISKLIMTFILDKSKSGMTHEDNPRVFMDISIGGQYAGRMEFELRADTVPKTAENFRFVIFLTFSITFITILENYVQWRKDLASKMSDSIESFQVLCAKGETFNMETVLEENQYTEANSMMKISFSSTKVRVFYQWQTLVPIQMVRNFSSAQKR